MPADADDLNAATGEEAANAGGAGTEGTEGTQGGAGAGAKGAAVVSPEAAKAATGAEGAGDKGGEKGAGGKPAKTTIASGGDGEEEDKAKAAKETDVDDAAKAAARAEEVKTLREALAKHASAGDKKAYDKELKRLERLGIERPEQIYGLWREAEAKITGGNLVKVPGKDAKPEEIAEFNKAMGVPDKAEDYLKDLKLENGAVIGDADKPIVGTFTDALHKAGAPPATVKAALNWYYSHLAQVEADLADADDAAERDGRTALREELGGGFKRETAAMKSLFDTAPGGADDKNHNSLYSRVMTARTQDGKLLGNDLDFLKQLIAWRQDIRPFATVTEDGAGSARSAEARLAEIEALRGTDRKKYLSPEIQAEELGLIAAIEKGKAQGGGWPAA